MKAQIFQLLMIAVVVTTAVIGEKLSVAETQDENLSTIKEIREVWNKRAKFLKSLECEWTAEEVIPAKNYSSPPPKKNLKEAWKDHSDWIQFPEDNLKASRTHRIVIGNAEELRYEHEGLRAVQEIAALAKNRYLRVFDGTTCKSYYGPDQTGQQRFAPLGMIHKEGMNPWDLDASKLSPLMFVYRPFSTDQRESMNFDNVASIEKASLNRESVILIYAKMKRERLMWYVRANDHFQPLRLERIPGTARMKNPPRFAIDFQYTKPSAGEKVPHLSGWNFHWYDPETGKPRFSTMAKITKLTFNETPAAREFQFEFPIGTKISNRRTKEKYILRKGGKKRMLTDDDYYNRVPYKSLLETN